MERELREELSSLSLELFGNKNRWRKLIDGILVESNEKMSNGKPIKVLQRNTPEQVLEKLKSLRQQRDEAILAKKIQKEAAGSV